MSLKQTKIIAFGAKIAVFLGLLAYIAHVLRQQAFDWTTVQRQLQTVEHPAYWLTGLMLFIPINWGLEALKWKILLWRVEETTFWGAYRGVLAGVSLGFALPAQLGDTTGRVLSLRTGARSRAIGASLVSGGMQFYVALVFGTAAWAYHLHSVQSHNTPAGRWLLLVLGVLSGLGVVFGFVRRWLVTMLTSRSALSRFAHFWQVAGQYTNREIRLALGAAILRYITFSGQFYMALRLLGIGLPPDVTASGIGLVFLAKTITPAFNMLSDLGVREAASLWVFAPIGSVAAPVLIAATFTLWLANVLMPVLAGLFWVWKLKWSFNSSSFGSH